MCNKTFLKKLVFVGFLMVNDENSGIRSGSGSISQRHVSADPDPHQNVMDPQHCLHHMYKVSTEQRTKSICQLVDKPANLSKSTIQCWLKTVQPSNLYQTIQTIHQDALFF
jgi:hypothetical protein